MDKKTEKLIEIIKKAKDRYSEENLVLAIPGFLAKSFTSFCSMREDLLLIHEFLKRLETEKDKIICASLTYSLISLYGKCFTDASQTKAPKLEPNQLFEKGSNFEETHNFLMYLRHNFIAHRGDTESEVEAAYLLVPKVEGEPQVRYTQTKQMKFSHEEIGKVSQLIDYLLAMIIKKIQKSGQKTYDAYLKNFSANEMTFMMLNNLKEEE